MAGRGRCRLPAAAWRRGHGTTAGGAAPAGAGRPDRPDSAATVASTPGTGPLEWPPAWHEPVTAKNGAARRDLTPAWTGHDRNRPKSRPAIRPKNIGWGVELPLHPRAGDSSSSFSRLVPDVFADRFFGARTALAGR
jgi:hypothetical protein